MTAAEWKALSWQDLELEFCSLCCNLGYHANLTCSGADDGVDVIVWDGNVKIAVQCKQYGRPVGVSTVRELLGAQSDHDAHKCALVAPGGLTRPARHKAEKRGVLVLTATKLARFRGWV